MRYLLPFLALLVLLVALFTYLTSSLCQTHLEDDLEAASRKALDDAGLQAVDVDFDCHDAILHGDAASLEAAVPIVSAIAGTRVLEANAITNANADSDDADQEPEEVGQPDNDEEGTNTSGGPSALPKPAFLDIRQAENELTLAGRVRNAESEQVIVSAAQRAQPNVSLNNELEVDPNTDEPAWFRDLTGFLTPYFSTVTSGHLELDEGGLHLRGGVPSQEDKVELGNHAISIMREPSSVSNQLEVTPPIDTNVEPITEEEEAVLQKAFQQAAIYFETGQDTITDNDLALLRELAETLKATPGTGLVVGGYADQSGNAEANQALSLKRATAVKEQLVLFGVAEDRLTVQSFGEEAGAGAQWKSRRVELSFQ